MQVRSFPTVFHLLYLDCVDSDSYGMVLLYTIEGLSIDELCISPAVKLLRALRSSQKKFADVCGSVINW